MRATRVPGFGLPAALHVKPDNATAERTMAHGRNSRFVVIVASTKRNREKNRRLVARLGFTACFTHDPSFHGLPFRVILRWKLLTTAVKEIAARIFRQWMDQQRAFWIPRQCDNLGNGLEVLAGLFFIPGGFSRRELLQLENGAGGSHMTGDASGAARTLGQKNWLHFSLEVVVVERAGFAGLCARGNLAQKAQQ